MIKKIKRIIGTVALLALLSGAGYAYLRFNGGVTHVEIRDTVLDESQAVQSHMDARCDSLDAKLDRIEGKLDALIRMATPQLPDGMTPSEY